ncbi:MAG: hypothetical protein APF81_26975 [Desulfosporosinus sp. BRH_c37]|nr:MAG: hypothetical protein APF81_26975 [Desulfosporosinus sp. BRH_c37]
MSKFFKRVLFGYKPAEVTSKMEEMQTEQQKEVQNLKAQIEEARVQLKRQEEIMAEHKNKIQEFIEKEHIIAEVLLNAQKRSQKIEEDAREKAQNILDESEEKLKKKQHELENLRSKITVFKEDFQRVLEKYQSSLDTVVVPPEEPFIPTVIISKKSI